MALTKVTYGLLSADTSAIDLNIDANTLYVDSSANRVGIGTSSPGSLLHLENAASPTLQIKDTTNNVILKAYAQDTNAHIATTSSHDLIIDTNNTERIHITAAGVIQFNSAYSFPTADGSASQFLQTDGSGNLSFATISSSDNTKLPLAGGTMTGVLKINSGDDSLPTLASSTKAVFATDNTANFDASISLISASNNGDSSIFFGDYANEDAGIIQYKNDNGGSDYMAISVNTSEALRILHNGNVGIGVTSAYTGGKLSLNGGLVQPSGNQHVIGVYGTSGLQLIGTTGGDNIVGTMGSSEPLIFRTVSAERMRIDSSGKVGIGETSPETSLHIKNAGNSFLTLERSGTTGGTGKFAINMEGGSSQQTTMAYDDGGKLVIGRSSDPATQAGFSNDFVLDSSGKLGIATTSPSAQLSVVGSSLTNVSTTGIPAIRAQGGYGGGIGLLDTKEAGWYAQDNGDTLYQYVGRTVGSDTPASKVIMTYKSSGNVGIGTSSPDALLDIQSDSNPTFRLTDNKVWNSGDSGVHGTLEWFTTDASTNAARVVSYIKSENNAGSAIPNGYLTFATAKGGGNVEVAQERMRIDASGNLLVGATTAGAKFHVNGGGGSYGQCFLFDGFGYGVSAAGSFNHTASLPNGTATGDIFYFQYQGTNVGEIDITTTATNYRTSSDYRLKQNEIAVWDGTTVLKQLKPYKFNWKADPTGEAIEGFFAHEVAEVVPNAVAGEKDGEKMQGIDHSKLVPLLVKTIQELEARITELESK